MPLVSEDALILQAFAYSETSKILRLLTPGHGVVSVMARGARRPRSRYGGVLEPFTEGSATFYLKPNRDLHTLGGFDLIHSGQTLGSDLLRFGGASVLAELVLCTASSEADEGLYDEVRDALRTLETTPPTELEATLLSRIWAVVTRLGYSPSLDRCLVCQREIGPTEDATFDYEGGGLRCLDCSGGAASGRTLPAAARTALRRMAAGETVSIERTPAHWALLARFLAFHVLEGRALRSLKFLEGALQTS